ncbi:hypothetical protein [Paraburkholderia youngii]|uniref:hypothetical protein n=1 Tax=Paraburkholderia youngii TaxID=2782701 RepID=UPI00159010FA|nr:hypothetical protein [Paraburkholderia youngii]NUX57662.1 hypothetical protein [Paraburkholderia youngii]
MVAGIGAKFRSGDVDYLSGIFRENFCRGSSIEKRGRTVQPKNLAPAAAAFVFRQSREQLRNFWQRSITFIELEVGENESI